jgi:hypothetical protein
MPEATMPFKEHLDALDKAHDLISQAGEVLLQPGMGTFSYDEHPGHPRTYTYTITEVRQKVIEAMNSINHAASDITDWIKENREDGQ